MIRYADDLVFFADSRGACEAIHDFCTAELGKLKLTIPPLGTKGKTEICAPNDPVEFLGVELAPSSSGYVLRISDKQMAKKRQDLLAMSNVDELVNQRMTITKFAARLSAKIDGWHDAYSHCDNFAAFEQNLENWRISVIEAIYRKGLGLDVDKLNRSARQFLEMAPLPSKKS